jgi:S1-C subfamily serine protease
LDLCRRKPRLTLFLDGKARKGSCSISHHTMDGTRQHSSNSATSFLVCRWFCVLGAIFGVSVPVSADSYGTGFFVSPDGYLVTNHHVIDGSSVFAVRFEERWIPARVIRKDAVNDLAILKADGAAFPVIPLQFGASVQSGDEAFTVGFPDPVVLGFSAKTTKGTISAMTGPEDDVRYYQTTVAIQPGNSGGPLCDEHGNVIAITTLTINALNRMKQAGYVPQNVNYGLKGAYLKPLLESIPSVVSRLAAPDAALPFRAAQQAVERAAVSVKSTGGGPGPGSANPGTAQSGGPRSDGDAGELAAVAAKVRGFLDSWLSAWRSKDLRAYSAHYHPNFVGRTHSKLSGAKVMNRQEWMEHKRDTFSGKNIQINISNVAIAPTSEGLAVSFFQNYRRADYSDNGKKVLMLVTNGEGRLVILEENFTLE